MCVGVHLCVFLWCGCAPMCIPMGMGVHLCVFLWMWVYTCMFSCGCALVCVCDPTGVGVHLCVCDPMGVGVAPVCVFLWVWVYNLFVCATCVWQPEVDDRHLPQHPSRYFLRQGLSRNWSLLILLDGLARDPPACFPNTGVTGCASLSVTGSYNLIGSDY